MYGYRWIVFGKHISNTMLKIGLLCSEIDSSSIFNWWNIIVVLIFWYGEDLVEFHIENVQMVSDRFENVDEFQVVWVVFKVVFQVGTILIHANKYDVNSCLHNLFFFLSHMTLK